MIQLCFIVRHFTLNILSILDILHILFDIQSFVYLLFYKTYIYVYMFNQKINCIKIFTSTSKIWYHTIKKVHNKLELHIRF